MTESIKPKSDNTEKYSKFSHRFRAQHITILGGGIAGLGVDLQQINVPSQIFLK